MSTAKAELKRPTGVGTSDLGGLAADDAQTTGGLNTAKFKAFKHRRTRKGSPFPFPAVLIGISH